MKLPFPAALNPDFAGLCAMPSCFRGTKIMLRNASVEVLAGVSRVIFWLHPESALTIPLLSVVMSPFTLRLTVRTRVSLRAATMLHPSEQPRRLQDHRCGQA